MPYIPTKDSPYAFTYYQDGGKPVSNPPYRALDTNLITDLTTLSNIIGGGLWVRYQFRWRNYETNPTGGAVSEPPTNTPIYWDGPSGNTDPTKSAVQTMDNAVAAFNAANINVMLTIQDAPDNYLIFDDSGTNVGLGSGTLGGPQAYSRFAQHLATRYDGNHGHGHVESIQIGNEEFDTVSGRTGRALGPTANAAIPAVRAINPALLMGICSVRKTPTNSSTHISNWCQNVFSVITAANFPDFVDAHCYYDGRLSPDPTSTVDTTGVAIAPELTLIGNALQSYAPTGQKNTPIYVLETGWNVGDVVCNPTSLVQTTLSGTISATQATPFTLNVASGVGFPTSGNDFYLIVKNEWMHCSTRSGTAFTIDQRNIEKDVSTSATLTHANGETVQWAVMITDGTTDAKHQSRAPYLTDMFDALRTQNPNPVGKLGIWTIDYQKPLQAASVSPSLGTGTGSSWKAITDYMTAHPSWTSATLNTLQTNARSIFNIRAQARTNTRSTFFITPSNVNANLYYKTMPLSASDGNLPMTASDGNLP